MRSLLLLGLVACSTPEGPAATGLQRGPEGNTAAPQRIVSLAPAASEILLELAPERLIGVDSASRSLPGVGDRADVGFARRLSAEGILSLAPDLVVVHEETGSQAALDVIRQAGVAVTVLPHDKSVDGVRVLIDEVAALVDADPKPLRERFDATCTGIEPLAEPTTGLFVYSRGAGTLQVSGVDTSAHAMFELAGIENAVTGYDGYKPLTAEAALQADPDWIVFTTRGLEALGGPAQVAGIPGLGQVEAAVEQRVTTVDDFRLLAFGLGTCEGASELRAGID